MSGGGEVRVLCQESGQESPRMPAWKREILERRKAKGGGSGGTGTPETSPGGACSQRVNGELTGNVNGSGALRDNGATGGSGRNYTITTASQHFVNNKEPQPMSTERTTQREDDRHESLVLQESLGPLEENPFIKLEKERRRRQDRENAARPVQHILELYGSVPGIRTIRAENIIIIESDPDYFPDAGGVKTRAGWQQNGVDTYSSLNDLLDRRGSTVTEIRAKEVVIYDTTLSKSEENLSTLGRPDHEVSYESCEGQGRVSRILQKFDSNYGKLQKKSHSTENLLDLDSSASSRPRLWPKPQPELVPKPKPGLSVSSQPPSPVFQGTWSSKQKPQPAASELSSLQHHPGAPQSVSSFRLRFEESSVHGVAAIPRDEPDRGQTKLTREREWEVADAPPKPKVPCSPETRRARAESPLSPVSSKVFRSSPEFEIRPCPKPDLSQIPDGDTQARALANLRLQSRNSFTVIPKRRLPASSGSSSPIPPGPVKSSPSHRAPEVSTSGVPTSLAPTLTPTSTKREEDSLQEEKEVERVARPSKPEASPTAATSPASPPTPEPSSPAPALSSPPSTPSIPSTPPFSPVPSHSPSSSPFPSTPSPAPEQPTSDHLPVTNIDDIEVEPPKRVPFPSPMVQRKKGNTFTVVPKRRVEPDAQSSSPEPQQDTLSEAPPVSTPTLAPYSQLGTLLKKRYPAVEEIEVIGGYLTLEKSCLSKTGSTGKKISFNESSLHSTYEYPSESSVWDSGEEDEDEDEKLADEQPSMVGRIHIPRASFAGSPSHTNNDLSSYIPKHSVDFSTWQEQKHEDSVYQEEAASQQMTEDVMLTPADSSSLSDYSSEPALYF
ncbi:taperin [Melanotaenia boesemani]|uniref:taperin n=1 Tax=Melanotaenia boesemani TaxID=1250792 RepID=UPI001C0552C3|nr:taperin [Melanotaenia boesemani]